MIAAGRAARGLTPFVHVLGECQDVAPVLGGIDVLVSTSASEGVPGVLIEALMAGCPVVAMHVGGVDTVVNDTTGVLVEPGDVDAMGDVTFELLRDAPRRVALGRAALLRTDEFSAARAAQAYADRFEALLAGAGDGPSARPD